MPSFPRIQKTLAGLFLILPLVSIAQTRLADSLKTAIDKAGNATAKANAIFLYCEQYNSINPDTLIHYVNIADSLIQKNKSISQSLADYYRAVYLVKKIKLDSATQLIDQNINILKHISDRVLEFKYRFLQSRLFIKKNLLKESIANSLEILQMSEAGADSLNILKSYVMLGWGYMELNQYREALGWLLKGEKIDQQTSGRYTQPTIYSNIASVYNNINRFDSAENYIKKAIALNIQKNDLANLANAYFIYSDTYLQTGRNAMAQLEMEKGLEIRKLTGDPYYIVSDIFELGVFYARNNEATKGVELVKSGIKMAKEYNLDAKLFILYNALAENYQALGDKDKYSETLNTIIALQDSLYKKNTAEALSEMQTKYEVQKKENIIIQQKLDLTQKNYWLYSIIFLLLVTFVIGYIFFSVRKKNQQLKMQQLLIDQKRKTTQAVMQAEENERKRIAADLHDSVAQKMVVAKLNLEVLEQNLPQLNQQQRKVYSSVFSLVDESCSEVRNLSHAMMPSAFFHSHLTDAIKDFIDKIESPSLQIHFNTEGDFEHIDLNTDLMIRRIIQECIQNSIKHARATRLDISMLAESAELDITIEDNGLGFDTTLLERAGGIGIRNIVSRIEFLNGTMEISSSPGKGCLMVFHIPLKYS